MDTKLLIKQVWQNPFIKKVPGQSIFATLLAAFIHPVLAAIGFDISAAAEALLRIGFVVSEEMFKQLLPDMVAAARKGIEALASWLERALTESPEVNEAAAQMAVEQTQAAAESLQETRPDEAEEVAGIVGQGMQACGGAVSAVSGPYAEALASTQELDRLLKEMRACLSSWASQSMEARRGSLIADSTQQAEGPAQQRMEAVDDSRITGSRQVIKK